MPLKKLISVDSEEDGEEHKGVSTSSLRRSRKIRKEFLAKFGIIPTSVLKRDLAMNKNVLDIALSDRGGGYEQSMKRVEKDLLGKGIDPSLAKACRHRDMKDFLSTFPQNVGRILVEFYCPPNGTVYDPFAGHNSRMQLVFELGRNYIGVDVSKNFMRANRKIKDILYSRRSASFNLADNDAEITLIEGCSSKVDYEDSVMDFIITSPPYWNIEYYGDEKEQLGTAKTYQRFIKLLEYHVMECFRVLKPEAFCCWAINDFRKNKKFYAFHVDVFHLFEKCGFEILSIYILDLGSSIKQSFVQDILKNKIFPKQHEYIIVGRKP